MALTMTHRRGRTVLQDITRIPVQEPEVQRVLSIKDMERQQGREFTEAEQAKILRERGVLEKRVKININGTDIDTFYREAGDPSRPTVLLTHGGGNCSSLNWRYQILDLAEHFHVIALDLPGYGETAKPKGHKAELGYSEHFVVQFMDALGIHKAGLVGNSMGGGISSAISHNNPFRVSKLVLLAPHNVSETEPSTRIRRLRTLSTHLPLPVDKKIMEIKRIKDAVGTFTNAFWDYIRGNDFEKVYDLSALKMPVAFFHGSADRLVSRKGKISDEEYAELAPGLFGKRTEHENGSIYVELKDVGHGPQYEHPEFINSEIIKFLSQGMEEPKEEDHRRRFRDILHVFRHAA